MLATSTALFRLFFFINDTAPIEIYTLSLHDALPICAAEDAHDVVVDDRGDAAAVLRVVHLVGERVALGRARERRSEEHTSELQSQSNLVCRLLLEKKKILPDPSNHSQTMMLAINIST